jgi:hypothetical protein
VTRTTGEGRTRAEKNAYARGYNTGRASGYKRYWSSLLTVIEYAKAWREKAREGMSGARCDACALWRRGGEACRWGYCRQGDEFDCSPDLGRAWAESKDATADARLISHENFACINFKREAP